MKVYKEFCDRTHANLFFPERPLMEPLAVTEIGYAHQPAGFKTDGMRRCANVLQFVAQGCCTFNGIKVNAPAVLYMKANLVNEYIVDEHCDDFLSYWIKCGGELAESLLREAGFCLENTVIPFSRPEKILAIFTRLTSEKNYEDVDDRLYMISGLYELLSLFSSLKPEKEACSLSTYTQTILDYIHRNYSSQISEKDLANIVSLSTNYMHKVFFADMKIPPINYLNSYRIERARGLLKDTDLPISRIAEAVGISGGDYFCRVFRKYNGNVSPTVYRKRAKAKIINNG